MSTELHHGAPGSFKTFAIIQRIAVPALYAGRTVITNVRGFDSLERIESAMGKPLPDGVKLICVPHDKAGFEHIARFFQWADKGALIIIDEVQRVFPTGAKSLEPYSFVYDGDDPDQPETVADAFDKHRHMNWDIYLSTTHIKKVNQEVRLVVEWAYRHRDQSGLIPFLPNYKHAWKEFRHDADSTGQSISSIDSSQKYSADQKVFNCYKSTATGEAKQSAIGRSVFGDPKIRIFGFIALLFLVLFLVQIVKTVDRFNDSGEEVIQVSAVEAGPVVDVVGSDVGVVGNDSVNDEVINDVKPRVFTDPFSSALIYYTGSVRVGDSTSFLFAVVIQDFKELSFTSVDLIKLGYTVELINDCLVLLTFKDVTRWSMCRPDSDEQPFNDVLVSNNPVRLGG